MNKELINEIYQAALVAEKKDGVPAIFTVAQAILESGWEVKPIIDKEGKNSFNIFGIKYHLNNGNFVSVLTKEYVDNVYKPYLLLFQAYETFEGCFEDHNILLTKYSYGKCLERYKKDADLENYVECVSKDYATDPFYARKIISIIKTLSGIVDEVEEEVVEMTESDEAIKFVMDNNIMKPFETTQYFLEEYLEELVTKEELAIFLYRFKKLLEPKVVGEGSGKSYTL